MNLRPRRTALLAAVLSAGAVAAALVGNTTANASQPGSGSVLTASNGTTTLYSQDGNQTVYSPYLDQNDDLYTEPVSHASWSPNGMKAAFVTTDSEIDLVDYNDGSMSWPLADPIDDGTRADPAWSSDGSTIFWSEQDGAGSTWQLDSTASQWGWQIDQVSTDNSLDYTNPDGGPDGLVAVQTNADDGNGNPTGTPNVVIYSMQTGEFTPAVTNAAQPAISPDGTKIAFVRSADGHDQIFVSDLSGGNVTQVTTDAADHSNPVWSPDGATIALNVGTAVDTVPRTGGSLTAVSGLTGKPAYEPKASGQVDALAGANRMATAAKISQSYWADQGAGGHQAQAVVLSRSDTFADALGGSALAAAKQGPLLLTPTASLDATTAAEIQRVLPTGSTVYVLGGTGAISESVVTAVTNLGYTVTRVAGANRYATSVAIANLINPNPDLVLTATGMDFPDALGAGAAAGSYDVPGNTLSAVVILTDNAVLPADTKSYLDDWSAANSANPNAILFGVGGQAANAVADYTSEDYVIDLVGQDRYDTAAQVAYDFFGGEQVAGIAGPTAWPDALAGGALLANENGPLLLSPFTSVTGWTSFILDSSNGSIKQVQTFGGGWSSGFVEEVGETISGFGGYSTSAVSPGVSPNAQSRSGSGSAGATGSTQHRTAAELKATGKKIESGALGKQ